MEAFDAPPPEFNSPVSWDAFAMLPSRSRIEVAIDVVVQETCCNMQFLDHKALRSITDEALAAAELGEMSRARKPLSLLFAILALAQRFEPGVATPRHIKKDTQMNGWVIIRWESTRKEELTALQYALFPHKPYLA